jgi:hypothetical protein
LRETALQFVLFCFDTRQWYTLLLLNLERYKNGSHRQSANTLLHRWGGGGHKRQRRMSIGICRSFNTHESTPVLRWSEVAIRTMWRHRVWFCSNTIFCPKLSKGTVGFSSQIIIVCLKMLFICTAISLVVSRTDNVYLQTRIINDNIICMIHVILFLYWQCLYCIL